MTFEEFFIKKKIDLDQLKSAEPALYEEFSYDFSQMGEKSFDHTKKFWFNRLRKIYHLKPVIKPEPHKPERNSLARQAEPLSSPTIAEKPLYSPKFKPRMASQAEPENTPEKVIEDAGEIPENEGSPLNTSVSKPEKVSAAPKPEGNHGDQKPAYKPRFKATAIKKEAQQTEIPAEPVKAEKTEGVPTPVSEQPQAKPAYKPRFKPGMLNKPKPQNEGDEGNDQNG